MWELAGEAVLSGSVYLRLLRRQHRLALVGNTQIMHVVGMFFFHTEDAFQHDARRRSSGRGFLVAGFVGRILRWRRGCPAHAGTPGR